MVPCLFSATHWYMPESSRLSLEKRRSPAETSTRFCAEESRQGREMRTVEGQEEARAVQRPYTNILLDGSSCLVVGSQIFVKLHS